MMNLAVAHGSIINPDQTSQASSSLILSSFFFFFPVETWNQTLTDLMANCENRHANTHGCFIPAHSM